VKAVELGDDGLRGLEYGEPVTQGAIDALLPGGVMRREDRPGGIQIHDHEPFGVQRQVDVRSPRIRTALGVAPGDRLGELVKRQRVTCSIQGQRWLDCHVPGTRFSLRTEGSGLTEKEMIDNVVDVKNHADHAIQYITWLGPVRPRELRAQPLERATLTRGGIGPVTRLMPYDQLAQHLPTGATTRMVSGADDRTLVVERDGKPFLRFEVSAGRVIAVTVDSPEIQTALGVRVGDAFGKALAASSRVTCYVEADHKTWRARCENGDVDLILETHQGASPGNSTGMHTTVPPLQVAADKIVEIYAMLH
jgi:hypothetical protein